MKSFNPTTAMISAANQLIVAMAHEQYVRPIVEKYQSEILASRTWPVHPDMRVFPDQQVTDIKMTYLMSHQDFEAFDARCQQMQKLHNLVPQVEGNCVLLEAESALTKAQFDLVRALEPVCNLKESNLRFASKKDHDRVIELCLRLMVPYLATEGADALAYV